LTFGFKGASSESESPSADNVDDDDDDDDDEDEGDGFLFFFVAAFFAAVFPFFLDSVLVCFLVSLAPLPLSLATLQQSPAGPSFAVFAFAVFFVTFFVAFGLPPFCFLGDFFFFCFLLSLASALSSSARACPLAFIETDKTVSTAPLTWKCKRTLS
jgi:hypothetical protein